MPSTYVTVQEVADLLRVSKMTIYRIAKEPTNPLGAVKVGRSIRLTRTKVEQYLADSEYIAPLNPEEGP